MKHFLLLIIITLYHVGISAQRNEIYSERIASLQVIAGDNWQSLPVVTLNGNTPINIAFDDLTHTYHRYAYKIEHCDADWTVSDGLFTSDFVEGFSEGNLIEDIEESLNTTVLYTHYQLQIPNSRCRLKMSGNYKLTVYDDNNEESPLFTACFMVLDPQMGVGLDVTTNTDIDINNSHQQVSLDISYGNLNVTDHNNQISTVIMQNRRWDNCKINPHPQYIKSNGMRWEHNRELIFEAGNEYHKFEILSTNNPTLNIDRIVWDGERFNAYIYPDVPRINYLYDEDANGAFYIRNSDNIENDRLSDYMIVHFKLMCPERVNGDVYINGVWTNDRFTQDFKMEYDESEKSYNASISLKQGYYSYQYLMVKNDGITAVMPTEGSYYQTENSYQALVYYRPLGGRTDYLVGYSSINTK